MAGFNSLYDLKGKINNDLDKAKSWQRGKFEVINKYIQFKQKYVVIGTISGFIIVGASFGILQYSAHSMKIYHVYVDGEKIGTVSDKTIIENWQSQELRKANDLYGGINLQTKNTITYEDEVKFKGSYDNNGTLNSFSQRMEIQARGVEIVVDGKVIGIVQDQTTANRILDNIKQAYITKSDKGEVVASSVSDTNEKTIELESIDIKESVNTKEAIISPTELTTENDMMNLLQKGTLEEKIYVVKPGDTISEIAVKFGLTTKHVYQLNPELKGEIIHIGDKLVVTAMAPLITVQTQEKLTQVESIPYKVVYKGDDTLFVNESKVVTKGKEGKKRVQYSQLKENEIVVEREVLNETVLEQPIDKVVLKGTKIIPSRGSGVLSWPTMGGFITSYYGPRWGSYHNAIDISGVKDYTVKAADNGTVIYTGWKGSYGRTVMIDHGNGMVTLYAHLSSISVNYGDKVAKGQKIGVMGSSGNSTGTHLHFEVRVDDEARNPLNYLGK